MRAAGLEAGRPVYLLCRSGVRSKAAADALTAAGLGPAFNVLEGFEGPHDDEGHRTVAGWKVAGLPVASGLSMDPQDWHPQTRAVRGGLARSGFDETAEALYLTSGFVYESAEQAEAAFKDEVEHYIYSRYGNPTVTTFEERMRLLEGAEACFATASGMAAVFVALAALCGAGDRVVSSRALFGSCFVILDEILPRWGVETVFVDGADLDQWREALSVPTTAVFFETPSNPMQELVDIAAVCELAHAAGATVVVDNVFGTPVFSHPLEFGADVVVYSATKHIDGQGRALGGAVLGTARVHRRAGEEPDAAHRAVAVAVQRLGDDQGPGDPRPAGARDGRLDA